MGGIMRWITSGVAILASVMGLVTAVGAENRGLSPTIAIVLAQATVPPGSTPQPNFILETCKQTESTGDPRSAFRAVDPAYMLANYLNNSSSKQVIFDLASIKNVTILQGTSRGKLLQGTSNAGRTTFHYEPIPNYTGNDQAIFLADFEGKRYKIVVNLVVSPTVGESPLGEGEEPVCPPPELIKVTKSSSGKMGTELLRFRGQV
jgi:hypothetical protein